EGAFYRGLRIGLIVSANVLDAPIEKSTFVVDFVNCKFGALIALFTERGVLAASRAALAGAFPERAGAAK
ncbi:MAG TPA: hypothetical protein VFB04_02835, partial [Terriglobales bacterium]|nr:hypothetical protein [Terriglobales bacterium]